MNGYSDEISFSVLDGINYESNHVVPDWIKQNVRWWSEGKLDDQSFVNGIEFLVKSQIIKVSGVSQTTQSNTIPSWVKTNAKWWADDKITEGDFLKGIEHLMKIGIIKVN